MEDKNDILFNKSNISLLGQIFNLVVMDVPTLKSFVFKDGNNLKIFKAYDEKLTYRDILIRHLRVEARKYITDRVEYYSKLTEKKFNRIFIKDTKSRWGSCSSKRNLNFNWRLVLAPPYVLDYVCAHEVAHLTYMNHSQEFWQLLSEIFPDYRDSKEWLRKKGEELLSF
jgi:hypothetical protein